LIELVADTLSSSDPEVMTCYKTKTNPLVFAFMHDVGKISGHSYQPWANHRKLDTSLWTNYRTGEAGADIPPMIVSVCNPKSYEKLDKVTDLTVHAMERYNSPEEWHIDHRCAVLSNMKMVTKNVGQNRQGFLENELVRPISGESFTHLLSVFGYCWTDVDKKNIPSSTVPTDRDICCFLALFSGFCMKTKQDFDRFIKHFRLKNFIGWAEDTPYTLPTRADFKEHARLCFNVERLSSLLRSLHTVRLAVGERQHRVVLLKDIFLCTRR